MDAPEAPTRARLVAAATRLLARDGYRGLSVAELLHEAGAPSGSLYHHFPGGKEELAATAIREAGAGAQAAMASLLERAGPRPAVEALFALALAQARGSGWLLGCPIGTPASDGVAGSEAIRAAVAESLDGWLGVIADALTARGVPQDRAAETAALVIAAYEGAILIARARRDPDVMSATARRLSEHVDSLLDAR